MLRHGVVGVLQRAEDWADEHLDPAARAAADLTPGDASRRQVQVVDLPAFFAAGHAADCAADEVWLSARGHDQ